MTSLTIREPFYSWLHNLEICQTKPTPKSTTLSEHETSQFQVGKLFGFLLMTISQQLKLSTQSIQSLLKLKQTNTLPVRLYNWNILTKAFAQVGIQLSAQTKKQIIDGQYDHLPSLIQHIYARVVGIFRPTNATIDASLVNLKSSTVEQQQPNEQFQSITQFIIINLSKHMQLSKQNTVNLLHDNNRLFNHLLISGQNSFEQILSFLQQIQTQIRTVSSLLINSQGVNIYCNLFKQGLLSQSIEIFDKCINVYRVSYQCCQLIRDWVKSYAIRHFVKTAIRESQKSQKIVQLISEIYDIQLFSFLKQSQLLKLNMNENQTVILQVFIKNLSEDDLNKYLNSPKFQQWIKILISNINYNKNTFMTIEIMKTLWSRASNFFTSHQKQLPILFSDHLKQIAMKPSLIDSYFAITTLYQLLQKFGMQRNLYAPHIYKTICSTLQLLQAGDKLKFMIKNLIYVWKILTTLPVYSISQTIIRALQSSTSLQLLQFITELLNEGKLEQPDEMQVLKIILKGTLTNPTYSDNFYDFIQPVIDYFQPAKIEQLIIETYKLALSLFFDINKNNPHFIVQFQQKKDELQIQQDIENYNMVIRIYKLLKLLYNKFSDLDQKFSKFICQTILSLKKYTKKQSQLLMRLLRMLHKETSINEMLEDDIFVEKQIESKSSIESQNQAQYSNIVQEQEKPQQQYQDHSNSSYQQYQQQSQISDQSKHKSVHKIQTESIIPIHQDIEFKQSKYCYNNPKKQLPQIFPTTPSLPIQNRVRQKKYSLSTSIRPSPTALLSIEEARNRRINKIINEQQKQRILQTSENQKFQRARKAIQKRSLQLGISKKKDVDVQCIFDWNTIKQHTINQLGITDIQLMDIQSQQDQHVQALNAIMKKFKKLWRFLFLKFSTFGGQKQKQQKMTIAELWKFIRYYNLTLLKRQQMITLVRLVNQSKGNRQQLQHLSYLNFEQFIIQYAIYNCKLNKIVCPSNSHALIKLIQDMKTAAFIKNDNISIFQNPQNMYFKEQQVIQEFNKKLIENPQFILPQGYKKVKQTNISFFNSILQSNRNILPESFIICTQIISQILQQKLQTTFIEPFIQKEQFVRAKPVLFQNLNQKLKQHKGYMQPKAISQPKSQAPRIKQIDKNQFKPLVKFSLGIKLGLSNVSMKNKYIGQQVAYLMNDILTAVENQATTVTNLYKVPILNPLMKQIQQKKQQKNRMQLQNNNKRNKRIQSIRLNLSKKKQLLKQIKCEQRKQKTLQAEQQRKKLQQRQRRYQSIKQKVQQKKLQDQEASKYQRQTQQRLKKIRQRERFKTVKQFITKQKQSLKNYQNNVKKRKEQQEIKKRQQQLRNSPDKQAKLYLNILKNDQNLLGKVVMIKNQYSSSWKSEQIKCINNKYEHQLRLLFDLLLKFQNSKITTEYSDKISLNTFNHFCLKFRVVPTIINHGNVTSIFKSLLKQNEQLGSLNFLMFQEALFRITIRAKDYLNSYMNTTVRNKQYLKQRKSIGVVDEYLFDATDVNSNTLQNIYKHLELPNDKLGMQARYRKALQIA